MKGFVNIRGRETKKARVEIIPMIDAIFFLLVFFMMSSLSMVKMKGMGVALPKASTAQSLPPTRFIVTVDKAGDTYLNLDKIDLGLLGTALQERINTDPKGVIIVNVDKTQPIQSLIDVMDIANQIKTPGGDAAPVSIATQPVDKAGNAVPSGRKGATP